MNEAEGTEITRARVTTSEQLIRSVNSIIFLRLVRSANVPPMDPSNELSNRLMIVSTATSLALPVV
ncbi:hypothetical protein D3C73_1217700 [compost metagenome]